jgi:hypothetical protein
MVTSTLPARLPNSVAASAGATGGLGAEKDLDKAGLRLADLEAFFAAEVFAPGGG